MINTLPAGHILQNEYIIEKVLGSGGFGITYLAKDINLNYLVVIKEFLPQEMASRKSDGFSIAPFTRDRASYEHLLKRFSEEAQLLANMRHPSIVKVIRFFQANNTAYFVMEYAKGETLKEYLVRTGTMNEEEILTVMMPILEGTKYIHAQGFLHRDIAPDNIYLKKDGMPMLIDFGAARDAIAEKSKSISSIVKEGYSSPEQYTVNNQQAASSDIYALGAVFYKMITGGVPPSAPHRQTALLNNESDPIVNLPEAYKNRYSQKLLHAVRKAMNIRAKDRFGSVGEFQEALMGNVAVDSDPGPISKPNSGNMGTINAGKNGLIVVFITVLLLLLAGIVYILIGEMKQKDQHETAAPVSTVVQIEPGVNEQSEKSRSAQEAEAVKAQEEAKQKKLEEQKKKELEQQRLKEEAEKLKKERETMERQRAAQQQAEAERTRREIEEERDAAERARQAAAASIPKCTPYRVSTIQLNVRDRPGVSSSVVGRVYEGDTVCIYSFSGKWGRSDSGWISGKYLVPVGSQGVRADNTSTPGQEQIMHFEENGIKIAVSYPAHVRAGEALVLKAVMVNQKATAKMGGLTLSFPDMISMSGEGLASNFDKLNGYTPPAKLYSSITGGNIYSKYFVIEGWNNKWPYGQAKGFSVKLTAPSGIRQLRVNVRGVLHIEKKKRNRKEVIIPTYSNIRDQQGYYTKQFSITIH